MFPFTAPASTYPTAHAALHAPIAPVGWNLYTSEPNTVSDKNKKRRANPVVSDGSRTRNVIAVPTGNSAPIAPIATFTAADNTTRQLIAVPKGTKLPRGSRVQVLQPPNSGSYFHTLHISSRPRLQLSNILYNYF